MIGTIILVFKQMLDWRSLDLTNLCKLGLTNCSKETETPSTSISVRKTKSNPPDEEQQASYTSGISRHETHDKIKQTCENGCEKVGRQPPAISTNFLAFSANFFDVLEVIAWRSPATWWAAGVASREFP